MSLMHILFRSLPRVLPATAVVVAAGCGSPFQLLPAVLENMIDTVQVNALQGTPIGIPSGFDVAGRQAAFTERGQDFDFAFDLTPEGVALVFPAPALGLDNGAGVWIADRPFADILEAPDRGFEVDSAVAVAVDTVFVIRSRSFSGSGIGDDCPFFIGSLPRYGKFRVLSIDLQTRVMELETLINVNCGYRGLEVGLPTR